MMKAIVRLQSGSGEVKFDFEFSSLNIDAGKKPLVTFTGIVSERLEALIDEYDIRQKFSYQTDLFGNKYARVLLKDLIAVAVVED